MSKRISKLDFERYCDHVNAAWLAGMSAERIWEELREQGCSEHTATLLTGYSKPRPATSRTSSCSARQGCLVYLLLVVASVAGTWASGYVVHRALERRLINSAFGAGTYERGVHIIDKRQNLSNGRQLPGIHGTLLTAGTVATMFIVFGTIVLTIRALFPNCFNEPDTQS